MSDFTPDCSFISAVVPSPNHNERVNPAAPDMILLHYTGMQGAQAALERLCSEEAKVSAHYVIFEDGLIFQCVPEVRRAWHAGVSSWEGHTDNNSRSIGLEIANPGHDYGYPDFPEPQIAAVIALCRDILARRSIRPECVVAHSDIAPSRKNDPGEKFPWARLAGNGIGLWVEPAPIDGKPGLALGDHGDAVHQLQQSLAVYGYGVEATGLFDPKTKDVVVAFQRHFRPARVDGIADGSTIETLNRLLMARSSAAEANSF
ncbi:MAG TPA: N-acetylmuramoyl-L-alanine amidase [Xanthobacteraceae bacterium]|jgi:N-acetylmuramoyl-L-alanine amidase|nr:N-acetylmuramoyl-L-alanine amidase [Xanthobacteraceae bacterium]